MSEPFDAPTYLTVQEAADLVRVSTRTIRNRVREGKLMAKKLGSDGRTLLLDQRDVLGLLIDARPEYNSDKED